MEQPDLTLAEKVYYAHLCNMARHRGYFRVEFREWGRWFGCSHQTVRRAFDGLEEKGWIQADSHQHGHSPRYKPLRDPMTGEVRGGQNEQSEIAQSEQSIAKNVQSQIAKNVQSTRGDKKRTKRNNKIPPAVSPPQGKSAGSSGGETSAGVTFSKDAVHPLSLAAEYLPPASDFDEEGLFAHYLAEKARHHRTRYSDLVVRRAILALHCYPSDGPRLGNAEVRAILSQWMFKGWPLKPQGLWDSGKGGALLWEILLHWAGTDAAPAPRKGAFDVDAVMAESEAIWQKMQAEKAEETAIP